MSGAWRRAFDGSSDAARDPMLRRYLSDLVRPYGLAVRDDLLDKGAGYSYGDMADVLLAEAAIPDRPVDLVVMAYAVSDVIPGRSTAAHLSYLCPSRPLAFAVCDQGIAAPFTALRLISAYARGAGCRRAALVVAEQAALLYDLPGPAMMPTRHAAVVLELSDAGPARLDAVRQHPDLSAGQVRDRLSAEIAGLSAGSADVTLIAGNGLTCAAEDLGELPVVLAAPAGQPCTGVWWELAGQLPGWQADGQRVLLADYDANLGCLCLSALQVGPGQPAAQPEPLPQHERLAQ